MAQISYGSNGYLYILWVIKGSKVETEILSQYDSLVFGKAMAFLFWGFLHGIYLIIEKILTGIPTGSPTILKNILSWIIVMNLVFIAQDISAETFNEENLTR